MENLREIERRTAKVEKQNTQSTELGAPTAPVGIPDSFEEHANLLYDLWAIAFQADITRVASFMLARELSNSVLIRKSAFPTGTIRYRTTRTIPSARKCSRRSTPNTWRCSARFLTKLKNMPAGDGNMLDNSMILYGSGMSNSNVHAHDNLPILVAAAPRASLRATVTSRFPTIRECPTSWSACCTPAGIPAEHQGDSTGVIEI